MAMSPQGGPGIGSGRPSRSTRHTPESVSYIQVLAAAALALPERVLCHFRPIFRRAGTLLS